MRRLGVAVSTLVGVLGLWSGATIASAAAVDSFLCMEVWTPGTGAYSDSACLKAEEHGAYVRVKPWGVLSESEAKLIECVQVREVGSGVYGNSECTTVGGSKEWVKVDAGKLGVTGTGGTVKLTTSSESIICPNSRTSTAKFIGVETIGSLVVTSTGCKAKKGAEECEVMSVGASAKTIVTHTLKGELGEVATSEAASGAGMLFAPQTGKEIATIAKASCIPELAITGMMAAEVTPVNTGTTAKMQTTNKLSFALQAGKQKIKSITVKGSTKKPELEAFGGEATDETAYAITFEEPIEVT